MARPQAFAPPQGSPFGRGPSVGRRGGFHIRPRAFAPPQGSAGRGHPALRPPGKRQPFVSTARPPRLAQNIKSIRRGGIYPARRCLRCHRVPGTMQASSPTEVCDTISRGGIYLARGRLRCHRVPGTMQASSPTEVCDTISATVSRLAAGLPSVVGADSISARGRLHRRRVRRDEGIPPYGRPESDSRSFPPRARPGWPKT